MSQTYYALVDCNNFYVSCERVFRPDLQHKPVAILSNNDGCIVARSNEVKALDIPMAAPYFKYKDLLEKAGCAVFSSNYALYGDMSNRVMNTLLHYCEDIEIYSIDEAFLLLRNISQERLASYASKIRETVYQHTGIPVSVGIGRTKTEAKLANHIAKKCQHLYSVAYEGVCIAPHDISNDLYRRLPVDEIWGIGRRYKKKLASYHIHTVTDILQRNDDWVRKHLTIEGLRCIKELRGVRCYALDDHPEPKKNIASTRSFGKPVTTKVELKQAMAMYCTRIGQKLRKQKSCAGHLTIFVMTNRFTSRPYIRSIHVPLRHQSNYTPTLIQHAHTGLEDIFKPGLKYKKAGVIAGGLVSQDSVQDDIFEQNPETDRHYSASKTVDTLNKKYGRATVRSAAFGYNARWRMNRNHKSNRYTTVWNEMLVID